MGMLGILATQRLVLRLGQPSLRSLHRLRKSLWIQQRFHQMRFRKTPLAVCATGLSTAVTSDVKNSFADSLACTPSLHALSCPLPLPPGVGKSCLLLRFCDDAWTPSFITTIGIDL